MVDKKLLIKIDNFARSYLYKDIKSLINYDSYIFQDKISQDMFSKIITNPHQEDYIVRYFKIRNKPRHFKYLIVYYSGCSKNFYPLEIEIRKTKKKYELILPEFIKKENKENENE